MRVIVSKPIKKHNYYRSSVTLVEKGTALKLTVPFGTLIDCHRLDSKQGYSFDVHLPSDDYALEQMRSIELNCLNTMIYSNEKWFDNGLDELGVRSLFRSCVHRGDSVHVYASVLRTICPANTDVSEWVRAVKGRLPINVTFTLSCDGMVIYPNYFGLRWVVSKISEYVEPAPEDIAPDIEELISFWKEKAVVALSELQEAKARSIERLERLDATIDKVRELSTDLKETTLYELECALVGKDAFL
jgi:hypothetical protein